MSLFNVPLQVWQLVKEHFEHTFLSVASLGKKYPWLHDPHIFWVVSQVKHFSLVPVVHNLSHEIIIPST